MTVPDLRQSCVEAGARALGEHHGSEFPWERDWGDAAEVVDAILPALAEAVEGLRGEGWPTVVSAPMPLGSVQFVSLDAVLALLADVQGDGDA